MKRANVDEDRVERSTRKRRKIESTAETQGPDTQHPRASFLGLPVELRLLIYSYVPEVKQVPHFGHYAGNLIWCARGANNLTRCQRAIEHMAILAVNKQIFAEAMPVVYGAIEFGPSVRELPSFAQKHVQKILVLCERYDESWYCQPPPRQVPELGMKSLWLFLSQDFPLLRQVRVHLYSNGSVIKPEQVGDGLTVIPKLERVIVGAHTNYPGCPPEYVESHQRVVAEAKSEVAKAGRHIDVVEEALSDDTCLVCAAGRLRARKAGER